MTPGGDDTFELGTDGPTSILVGVDGSTTSLRAASYAAGLARRQLAPVVVVYVAPGASMASAVPGGSAVAAAQQEALDEFAEDMRQRADEASRDLGVDVTFIATRGDPFTELRRIADEIHADAVVVGASAKAGHRLVGSLAVRLVRANKWPVTVVPLCSAALTGRPSAIIGVRGCPSSSCRPTANPGACPTTSTTAPALPQPARQRRR